MIIHFYCKNKYVGTWDVDEKPEIGTAIILSQVRDNKLYYKITKFIVEDNSGVCYYEVEEVCK
jgi:hypothetical protein